MLETNGSNTEKYDTSQVVNTVVKISKDKLVGLPGAVHVSFDPKDREKLKEDIAKHGIKTPLHVYDAGNGTFFIVAGNNRCEIGIELGMNEFPCLVLKNEMDENELQEYSIMDNLARRHLTPLQRSELGLELMEIETKKALNRKTEAGKNNLEKYKNPSIPATKPPRKGRVGKTIDIVADKVHVSPTTLKKVMAIRENNPELLPAIAEKKMSIEKAYTKLKKKATQGDDDIKKCRSLLKSCVKALWNLHEALEKISTKDASDKKVVELGKELDAFYEGAIKQCIIPDLKAFLKSVASEGDGKKV